MTAKRFLRATGKINFSSNRYVASMFFISFFYISLCYAIKNSGSKFSNNGHLFLQSAPLTDSIPLKQHPKRKNISSADKKPAKRLQLTTKNQRIKIPMVTVTGRRMVDTSDLFLKDTAKLIKLSWQLSGAKNTSADSIGKNFFQYINKYYHLDNFEPLARQLDSGLVNGQVNISVAKDLNIDSFTGIPADTNTVPHWRGTIGIDSTRLSIPSLGASYLVDSQKIALKYPQILLNNFVVQDAAHNRMVATGAIISKPAGNDELNLNIDTKNFTLLNVQRAIANQLYGFASVDAVATIRGSTANPVIDGNITLNDNTDVTIILPQNNANKEAENSMVRFIKKDTFALPEMRRPRPVMPVKPVAAQLLHYNFNITANPHAALTFILDPSNGDELKLYGDARLKAGIDSAGALILSGLYKLDSGYYTLNYQFLQKQFTVLPGSTIVFQGAPADAQINITALYKVSTVAKELLENEVGLVDAGITNSFKKEIPFKVLLKLSGPIKNPTISFDIEMPDSNVQINKTMRIALRNKLNQLKENPSAINKQVFSLILYNRFVGEQSTDFFKGSGTGDGGRFDDLSHESVSKFLSSALDNIAADLFKTLDVDHDLNNYRDYGNGDAQTKTEIKIGATKSFINDRLSLNVGKNYGIDGQDASAKAAQQKGVGFLPDVTLNYKFTKDGKYRYRSYKKNQFEVIVDGYVTESGVSLMITLDYDKFSELINRK